MATVKITTEGVSFERRMFGVAVEEHFFYLVEVEGGRRRKLRIDLASCVKKGELKSTAWSVTDRSNNKFDYEPIDHGVSPLSRRLCLDWLLGVIREGLI